MAGNIPGRTQTLPTAIFSRLETGDDAAALRLVAVSLVLALVSLTVHQRLARRAAL